MKSIVILGKPDFVIGFELAGIKDTIVAKDDAELKEKASEALENKDAAILVMHKNDVLKLPERLQEMFENSVRPTTVMLTEDETSDDRFRKQIQKAIGVDVWNK